jgi:hypothetical protein
MLLGFGNTYFLIGHHDLLFGHYDLILVKEMLHVKFKIKAEDMTILNCGFGKA